MVTDNLTMLQLCICDYLKHSIQILALFVVCPKTDEHNGIIAGDIITIQKKSDKMSCYSKFDRTLMS